MLLWQQNQHIVLNLSKNIIFKTSFIKRVGWLVGCCGVNGPLRQYFSLYRTVSQREGERGEKEERKDR